MNNKNTLLRAQHSTEAVSAWTVVCGHTFATSGLPEVVVWRAALTWCYKAGEAADGDAWDLLVHTTQVLLSLSPWSNHTSVIDAREVVGNVARCLTAMGEIPA